MTNADQPAFEEWRVIKEFQYYQFSSFGRIKSMERTLKTGNGGHRVLPEKILKQAINIHGYLSVTLCKNNTKSQRTAHRLIARAFLGESKLQVNHKNGIKTDNRVENLEYLSCRENIVHYHNRQNHQYPLGVSRPYKKFHAMVSVGKKILHLGYFHTAEEASKAYQDKVKSLEA